MLVLAQAVDPISGGAGWVGAGLLGLVLGWFLLVRLPANDKMLREIVKEKDDDFRAEAKEMRESFARSLDRVCSEFAKEMEYERIASTKQFERIAVSLDALAQRQRQQP